MSVYGLFQPSVMGMMSQAHSLSNIGFNIANVNTGGYKATDTQFATLVEQAKGDVDVAINNWGKRDEQ